MVYIRKRAHESLQFLIPVAYREIREYIAEIAELYLYVVFVSKNIVHLDSRKPRIERKYREFRRVEIVNAVFIDYFPAVSVISADSVYFASCVLCHFVYASKYILAPQRQISPRYI